MNIDVFIKFSIGPLGSALIATATLPFLAWIYTPEAIGELLIFQLTCSFGALFLSLGLDQAYVRFYHQAQDKGEFFLRSFLPGFALAPLFIYLTHFAQSFISTAITSPWFEIGIYALFLERFFSVRLRSEEKGIAFSCGQISPKIIFIALVTTSPMQFSNAEKEQLIAFQSIAWLFGVITQSIFIGNKLFSSKHKQNKSLKFGYMLAFGFPLAIASYLSWGLSSFDRYLLKHLGAETELGIYSIAIGFAGVGLLFQQIFSTVWHPLAYKSATTDPTLKNFDFTLRNLELAFIVFLPTLCLGADILVYILPTKYSSVPSIFYFCILPPLLNTLSEATGIGIGISKKTWMSALAYLPAIAIGIVFSFLLIPNFGAIGAACACALGYSTLFIAKTELSVLSWRSFKRSTIYRSIIIYFLIIILTTYLESKLQHISTAIWGITVLVVIYNYKTALLKTYRMIRHPAQ